MFKIYKFKLFYKEGGEIKEEDIIDMHWNGVSIETVNGKMYNSEAHVIVQFANCFDKTGKPIFQGSILKNTSGLFFEVIVVGGNFGIVVNEDIVFLGENTRNFEVVGDIFRNRDLVETPVDESIFSKNKNEEK